MTTNTLNPGTDGIAAAARLLLGNCRGPATMKARLRDWADLVAKGSAEAWRSPALNAAGEALVVLAFANAAFRLAPVPGCDDGRPTILARDQGGYFAAMELVKEIIGTAPICPTVRTAWVDHVSDVLERLTAQLEKLLLSV